MNIFVGILGLGLLVLVHEAGHFFTARAVGMSPRKFYIGFPPPLVRVTRKGIEYGIGAIPLGGYVKIPGMHRPAPSDLDVRGPYFGAAIVESPELRPAVERIKERLAEGDMAGARTRLEDLERALGEARVSSRARKAAERGLRELKDGLGEDAYWRQRAWKRIAVIFAGPGTNFAFAILLFAVLLTLDTYRLGFVLRADADQATPVVERVNAGDPADTMGMRAGDRIVALNGRPVDADDISRRIRASKGDPITVTVVRDGRRVSLGPIRARKDEGYGALGAVGRSLELTGIVTREIGKSLLRLVQGEGREEISSPVGIVEGSSQALDQGVQTYLWVLGLISLSLALLNLLPLLPLDGGHIAFSIVEGIRGRSVGREVYERVSAVGIALVLLLFFVGLSNDVNRLSD
jgi:regulator of sigma E protease